MLFSYLKKKSGKNCSRFFSNRKYAFVNVGRIDEQKIAPGFMGLLSMPF